MALNKEAITAQIGELRRQHQIALETAQQSLGAIAALEWALSEIGGEQSPPMTEQQFCEAIARGQDG